MKRKNLPGWLFLFNFLLGMIVMKMYTFGPNIFRFECRTITITASAGRFKCRATIGDAGGNSGNRKMIPEVGGISVQGCIVEYICDVVGGSIRI